MIIAGIVTYNPDISRLNENIYSIRPQVDQVVIYDNASANIDKIVPLCTNKIHLIINHSKRNNGIAFALNEICRYSISEGCQWVLTLDQDSVCPPNLISEYSKLMEIENAGIISPRIADRNMGLIDDCSEVEQEEIDACITSASLLNLKAWEDVGGFWDDLFIDMVDFDMCWSLKNKGYHIIRTNTVSLLHELGHGEVAIFKGHKVPILNHGAIRYYYIFRNTIAVGKKHGRRYQCFRWNMKRLYLVLKYETGRTKKILSIIMGVFDGITNHLGYREG